MNLFMIPPDRGPEDRFTAQWVALLNLVPALGQGIVDRLARLTNLPKTQFVEAIDHPWLSGVCRPDALLVTTDRDIYCEHKLTARLGPMQLTRYLRAIPRSASLALIAGTESTVPTKARRFARYLAPVDDRPQPHLLWQDFYLDVLKSPGPLAGQFAEYMRQLGLDPTIWGKLGDIFTSTRAANAFRSLWDPIVAELHAEGIRTPRRSDSLGLQMRYLRADTPLTYAAPTVIDDPELPFRGKCLQLSVWTTGRERRRLPIQNGFVARSGRQVFVKTSEYPEWSKWRPDLACERCYFAPLEAVLLSTAADSAKALHRLMRTAIKHLRNGRRADTIPLTRSQD